jgi:acyl transferase domain-containing protein/acyl carrier protein
MFGITETTIHVTYKEIKETEISSNLSNIGRTLPTLSAYFTDRNLNLLPIGVPGELCVAGEGVARGYLNNPELTSERFDHDLWDLWDYRDDRNKTKKVPGKRIERIYRSYKSYRSCIYRSGDLARRLSNGDMECLGRIDQQVKVRGFRIELGEIESRLVRHKEINDAVVVLIGNEQETQLLGAYFVSPREMAITELREYLFKTMPDYMVPSYFIQVEKIPLTPNGKVDRKALPEPGLNVEEKYEVQPGEVEKKLVEIWSEVLGRKSIGIDDNFFDIGGNSLNIIKVNKRLKEAFKKEAAVIDLFRYTTIRSLAQFLQRLETEADALKKDKREKKPGLRIAVIGMAGRFPGAKHIHEFWENLKNGVEFSWFFTDRELESSGVDSHLLKDSNYISANGILEGIEYFDSGFFGCSPREAEIMDPQARIFHECTWSALEDAGYCPGRYEGLIGLYAGAMYNFEWEARVKLSGKADELGGFASFLLTNKDFLSTWISYKLNLKGPAVVVQTACSTSLAAIHLACQALLNGECDLALAGGVSVTLFEKSGYLHQEGMILSADGHCRAFDAKASGTITGNGAAVVVLKPLETAAADNDHIYAIVKGSAINNDGIRKVGFTAPSIEGQAEAIIAAQETAGVEPASISYVETHGTGTPLGDPVEIEALSLAFKTRMDFSSYKKNSCALGSVKTNIGHLDAAAGAAGLIKTVLALYHRKIPPSLHFETPNPKIDFNNSPFYVNTRLKEWKPDAYPLRAGVSSFGIGGTNAHVVLEEAPGTDDGRRTTDDRGQSQGRGGVSPPSKSRKYQLIPLSAKTQIALEQTNRDLLDYLKKNSANPGLTLADAAYTLQVGRGEFKHRQMLGCSTFDEIINNQGLAHTRILHDNPQPPTVIFMFPGQGSQYVNMGLDLYLTEPIFRGEMDRCFEILKPIMGYDIKEILYPVHRSNRSYKSHINQTEIAQPVIFAFQYALARLLIRWGIQPRVMIGHSIGEYTAACLSGVFSLEDALALVSLRGKLMREMPAGSMLSVSLPAHELVSLLEAHGDRSVCLAAVNSSSLCTVSGPNEAIEAFARQLTGKGIVTRKLHASHAFHSHMMDPVLEKFAAGFRRFRLNPPGIPYISNLTGTWLRPEQAADPAYWAAQLRKTVLFADGINQCLEKENPIFIEPGPGNVLSTFTRKHKNKKPGHLVINLIRHPREDIPGGDLHFFFNHLGRLWLYNVPINWREFHAGEKRHRISLPTYPFELKRYPLIKLQVSEKESKFSLLRQNRRNKLEDWFYVPQWVRANILPHQETPGGSPPWLIFMDDFGLGEQLVKHLEKNEKVIILVKKSNKFSKTASPAAPGLVPTRHSYTLVPGEQGHYEKLFQELQTEGCIPGRIVHLWNITGGTAGGVGEIPAESLKEARESGFYSLTWLARAIGKAGLFQNRRFYLDVVTDNMQEVIGGEGNHPEKAVVLGPVQVIPREYPNIFCRGIDIEFPVPGRPGEQQTMDRLVKELAAGPSDQACQVIALRGNYRWLRTFVPICLEKPGSLSLPLKEKGVYLITGGLGGIGLVLAEYLVKKLGARVILLGRSFFPGPGQWRQWLDTHEETDGTSGKIRKLQELNAARGQVMVFSADTANEEQMQTVIREILKNYDRVDGVIHSAGTADGCMIQQRTRETSDPVLIPKLEGTRLLDTLLKDHPPDFFVLCSSLSSFLAPFGQAAYCSANAFLDAFAHYKNARSGTITISINWGAWQEVGMAAEAVKKLPTGGKNPLKDEILPSEGVEAFERILASRLPQAAVSTGNLPLGISNPMEPHQEPYIYSPTQTERESKTSPTQKRPELSTKYIEPEDELEQTLAEIIQNFLSIEKIGIDDNFFELGLSSLDLVQIAAKFKKVLEKDVPVVILFKYSTVRALAGYVKQDGENKDSPEVKDEPGDLLQSTMDLLDPAAR